MKRTPLPNKKRLIVAGLVISLLSPVLMSTAVAYDNGYRGQHNGSQNHHNAQNIHRDGNFGVVAQKLRKSLTRSGYQVMDIQPSDYRGSQSLVVFAKKNNQPYEFNYTYPNLKLINSAQKDWSNIWQDKNQHHNHRYDNHYNNGKYDSRDYRTNNNKNTIKKEARYAVIEQRAVRKVADMGYNLKKVELKENNGRGVFEIEAKRGSQDYDIVLGYPNLNVIKLEKD